VLILCCLIVDHHYSKCLKHACSQQLTYNMSYVPVNNRFEQSGLPFISDSHRRPFSANHTSTLEGRSRSQVRFYSSEVSPSRVRPVASSKIDGGIGDSQIYPPSELQVSCERECQVPI
jgi:hypothetical protein